MGITEDCLTLIEAELERATSKFGPFSSTHEGIAVLWEEMEELWDGIRANAPASELRKEATQVGAMALRFMIDLTMPKS